MSDTTTEWDKLDMKTKAYVIREAVRGGVSKNLDEIKQLYNTVDSLNNIAKQQNPNIIQRLNQNNPKTIEDWKDPKRRASHKIGSYDNRVIGIVQQDSTGNLVDYSNPINHKGSNMWDAAIKSAEQNKDYVEFGNPKHAEIYGQFYKMSYPQHFMPKKHYKDGGPKDEDTEYNIFEDSNSFKARDTHRKSLEAFVKNNPKLYGLNTADFVDFLSQIAGLESGYRSKATNNASTYSGYYGLKNGHASDDNTQHKKAFQHLASIFKENITKQDIDKAISLGITSSQLLAKYWNQGNRVTNYLYNGTDNTDALGTKISRYGWNVTAPVEYKHLVPEGITQDFVLVENAKSLANATKLARNQYIDYNNRDAYIKKVNVERYKNKKRNPNFIDTKLQVGDTIFLTPMNVPTINKK